MTCDTVKTNEPLSMHLPTAIRQAVGDVLTLDKARGFRINMYSWHWPVEDGEGCSVCLAGAWIHRRTDIRSDEKLDAGWEEFPQRLNLSSQVKRMLIALDDVRTGDLEKACAGADYNLKLGALDSIPTGSELLEEFHWSDWLGMDVKTRWAENLLAKAAWLEANEAKEPEMEPTEVQAQGCETMELVPDALAL